MVREIKRSIVIIRKMSSVPLQVIQGSGKSLELPGEVILCLTWCIVGGTRFLLLTFIFPVGHIRSARLVSITLTSSISSIAFLRWRIPTCITLAFNILWFSIELGSRENFFCIEFIYSEVVCSF